MADLTGGVACGVGWAEGRHDVAIVDGDGTVVASERIGNDPAGLSRLLELLARHETGLEAMPVAIETSQGLLVAGLRAAGRTVFAVNPLAVSRYRDRYRAGGGKSDAFDAMALANVLRTDRLAHRPLPADTNGVDQAETPGQLHRHRRPRRNHPHHLCIHNKDERRNDRDPKGTSFRRSSTGMAPGGPSLVCWDIRIHPDLRPPAHDARRTEAEAKSQCV